MYGSVTHITAIEGSSHLTHRSGNDIAFLELSERSFLDDASCFDSQDARESDVGAVTLPREHLTSVQTTRFDADEDPARLRCRYWTLCDVSGRRKSLLK